MRALLALRAAHPVLWDPDRWGSRLVAFGANGAPDLSHDSRSIAWAVDGLYIMANMWWESVEFDVQTGGDWHVAVDTDLESGIADGRLADRTVGVAPRSIVVLRSSV